MTRVLVIASRIGVEPYSDADVDCSEGEFYQRVDTEQAFIAEALGRAPAGSPRYDARGGRRDAGGAGFARFG